MAGLLGSEAENTNDSGDQQTQQTQQTQADQTNQQTQQTKADQTNQQTQQSDNSQASQGADLWSQIKQNLPEELVNDPSLQTITNEQDLVKSYIHAQKAVGKNKVSIPDKHGTEQDWRATLQQLGAPENKDGYEINIGEDAKISNEYLDKMKEAAAESGILPWQLEKVVSSVAEFNAEALKNAEQTQQTQYESELNELKKEWGETFDSKVKKANAAFKELADESTRNKLLQEGFGSDPKVVRLLAKAADYLSEDQLVGNGATQFSSTSPSEAMQRAQEIQRDLNHPYHNPSHPKHKEAKQEVSRLYQIAFPE